MLSQASTPKNLIWPSSLVAVQDPFMVRIGIQWELELFPFHQHEKLQ